jgi:hypothetical protein
VKAYWRPMTLWSVEKMYRRSNPEHLIHRL